MSQIIRSDKSSTVSVADYAGLRAYNGNKKVAYVTGYLGTAAPQGIVGHFQRDDTDKASADNGGTIIVAANGVRWKRAASGPVIPQYWGAKGDGSDDYIPLNAMYATGLPWSLPYTPTGYGHSATLTISANGTCDGGFLVPTAAIGGAENDIDKFAVIIASAGYAVKRRIVGLKVQGSVPLRTALVKGIRVDCPNAHLINCDTPQFDYGIVVRTYSVKLTNCNAWQCNTNLSAYAPSLTSEINALTIDGGNYDSPVLYSANIGDLRWSDALPAGTQHGVVINLVNGANFDGGEIKIDNVSTVNIEGIYNETSATDTLIRLGGSGDGNCRNVRIRGNYLKTAKYSVRCDSGVEQLSVRRNFLSNVSVNALFLTTELYPPDYVPGVSVGCFTIGQEVRLAFGSIPLANVRFDGFTLEHENLRNGIQDCMGTPAKWYPGGSVRNANNRTINISSSAGAFYTAPAINKAGTVAGNVFTFTTPADARAFNGGDRIVTVPAGATYVRSVDYEAGTMLIDGGATANGAATVSQSQVQTQAAA
ncbi:hypothetical protein [Massilia luteola]|uniref:hypothetical protein n=1 Tax=Massilia luteola TaxID=3081751 RepID=UPI002ACBE1DE|nr:hypothetical protein [Massilia sp. Gc5]